MTEPRARARHNLDRSVRVRQMLHIYYIVRNRFLFVRKHLPRRRGGLYARRVARAALTALVAVARGRPRRAGAVVRGVLDGLRGRFGEQRARALRDRPGQGPS